MIRQTRELNFPLILVITGNHCLKTINKIQVKYKFKYLKKCLLIMYYRVHIYTKNIYDEISRITYYLFNTKIHLINN